MRSTFKILFYTNKGKEKDSIPTIPSMTQPRKNSERNAKEEKEAKAEIVNAYPLVLHVSYWGTLFNAP